MKAAWQALRNRYWDARSVQERRIMTGAAGVLLPVLAYLLLWQPSHDAVKKLRASVPNLQADEARLRMAAEEVEQLRHRPRPAMLDALAMRQAVEDSAARHGLRENISGLDLMQPNGVRVALSAVSFDKFLKWLQTLQAEQHIRAESLNVSMLPQAGMVKVSVTLVNGGTQ